MFKKANVNKERVYNGEEQTDEIEQAIELQKA